MQVRLLPGELRPYRLIGIRTALSQSANAGSNPAGVAIRFQLGGCEIDSTVT
jgi:hypothetical protein